MACTSGPARFRRRGMKAREPERQALRRWMAVFAVGLRGQVRPHAVVPAPPLVSL